MYARQAGSKPAAASSGARTARGVFSQPARGDAHQTPAAGAVSAAGSVEVLAGATGRVEEVHPLPGLDGAPRRVKCYARHYSLVFTKLSISAASCGPTITFQPGSLSSSSPLICET